MSRELTITAEDLARPGITRESPQPRPRSQPVNTTRQEKKKEDKANTYAIKILKDIFGGSVKKGKTRKKRKGRKKKTKKRRKSRRKKRSRRRRRK